MIVFGGEYWFFLRVICLQNRELVYGSAKLVKNVLQVLDKWGSGVLQWWGKEKT